MGYSPQGRKDSDATERLHFCRQESVVRNRGARNLVSSSCVVSKTVINWCQLASN